MKLSSFFTIAGFVAATMMATVNVAQAAPLEYRPVHKPHHPVQKPYLKPNHKPVWKPAHKPAWKPNRPGYRPPVVVLPSKPHRPHRPHYKKWDLPKVATFAVIAGLTYAVINDQYYEQKGDTYVHVDNAPNGTTTTVTTSPSTTVTTVAPSSGVAAGTMVDMLPSYTKAVTVNGATFYVAAGTWYAPIQGMKKYVVVEPQL